MLAAVGALLLGRLLAGFLYGIEPYDPASLLAVAGLLLVVALSASFFPARRTTRASPREAFRSE